MSERSARKWQCGPLPSETKTERHWRTRPDPLRRGLGGGGTAPAPRRGRRRAQGNDNYRVAGGEIPRQVQRLAAPHPATATTRLAGTQRPRPGGLLPPGAPPGARGPTGLHPLQLPGSHHRRPPLPPPAVPAGAEPFGVALRRGGHRRDLPGPEAGTPECPVAAGRCAPGDPLPTTPQP